MKTDFEQELYAKKIISQKLNENSRKISRVLQSIKHDRLKQPRTNMILPNKLIKHIHKNTDLSLWSQLH